jgi:soluble lytic murein transglycosylase-like protein
MAWFKAAGARYGVPWYVLAAIAKVESDFNPDASRETQ